MDTFGWVNELNSIEPHAPFDDLEWVRDLVDLTPKNWTS